MRLLARIAGPGPSPPTPPASSGGTTYSDTTAALGVLLLPALIVSVHRVLRWRKRPTANGDKHTVDSTVYTC